MSEELAPLEGSRILVTGAEGMLGRAFVEALSTLGTRVRVVALGQRELDVTRREQVLAWAAERPDLILHCGGLALADVCEREPERARNVHVDGSANVAELARATGARVFYPQSVFIFDGTELPVTEHTAPSPTFVYGTVKLEAERLLLATVPDALIVRMAGFFGGEDRDKNFVGQFLRTLHEVRSSGGGDIEVGDRVWQPTYTLDLAANTLVLLAARRSGVYHMGAVGEASFFEVARVCVDELGLSGEITLRQCPSDRFDDAESARRPSRMVTANRRLEAEGLCRQRPWEDALREYLRRPFFDSWRA